MPSWPHIMLENMDNASAIVHSQCVAHERLRRKRKKNRRMLFKRKKHHNILHDPTRAIRGFETHFDGGDQFRGFDSVDEAKSILASLIAQSQLEEINLLEPVRCISIGLLDFQMSTSHIMTVVPHPRSAIRVLSLFDGIATGLHILKDRLGLVVDTYYSSEIEPNAIRVQKYNFYGEIVSLGCINKCTDEMLHALGPIDLLIGGSPCNELSRVNCRRKGLFDPCSSGHLFFDFVRIRNYLLNEASKTGKPFFWLLENTTHLDASTKCEMTRCLESPPVALCSSHHLPVKRKRLFWGNIPYLHDRAIVSRACTSHKLQDLLKPYRVANLKALPTLTSTSHSERSGHGKVRPVTEDGTQCYLTAVEKELALGFPMHYTDTGDLSVNMRKMLLGRAWCVPVVASILHPLSEVYLTAK